MEQKPLVCSLVALAVTFLAPAVVSAQELPGPVAPPRTAGDTPEREGRKGFGGQFRVSAARHGNFLQAPKGQPGQDVDAYSAELRVWKGLSRRRPVRIYAEADWIDYQPLGRPAGGAVAGLEFDGPRHAFEVNAGYHWARPTSEVGDTWERANAIRAGGRFAYRFTRDWELSAQAGYQHEEYDLTASRENDYVGVGGSLRFRGFGSGFSPEIGFSRNSRSVRNESDDSREDEGWFRIRVRPSGRLYLSSRFRYRLRDYTTVNPTLRSFGRRDHRRQLTVSADLRTTEWLNWSAYYAWENASSTVRTRSFVTHSLVLSGAVLF